MFYDLVLRLEALVLRMEVGTCARPVAVGQSIWGFPKIRGTILGILIIGIIVFWGLYWGPLILGNYHISWQDQP